MPSPTIDNFFGASAQVISASTNIVATAIDPALILRYSDFNAESWNALAAGEQLDPEKWLTSILKKAKTWSVANTDDLPNLVVFPPSLGLELRNAISIRRFTYSVDIFQPDTGGSEPDPDLI